MNSSSNKKIILSSPEKPPIKSPPRTPVKDGKVEKEEEEFVTSPIKFENGENDTPKTKKQTKAPAKSKSKTPKANSAKKIKVEKKTTPKSSTTSEKKAADVSSKINVKEEKTKPSNNESGDKKENIKTEQPKKSAAIHSFFTNTKTAKDQATNGVSGAEYNPGKLKYHPIDDAFWKRDEKYDFRVYTITTPSIT